MPDQKPQLQPCPNCGSPVVRVEEGGAEHDEWGRKMWDLPDVTYYGCGRVAVDGEIHEADACALIAAMRPVVEAAVAHVEKPTDLHTGVVLIDEIAKWKARA